MLPWWSHQHFFAYADETRAKLLGAGKTLLRFSLSKGPALALLPVAAWTAVRSMILANVKLSALLNCMACAPCTACHLCFNNFAAAFHWMGVVPDFAHVPHASSLGLTVNSLKLPYRGRPWTCMTMASLSGSGSGRRRPSTASAW